MNPTIFQDKLILQFFKKMNPTIFQEKWIYNFSNPKFLFSLQL